MMKFAKLLVMICVLALTANAFAVYTPHIWHEDPTLYAGQTVYLKSAPSSPDNSPMHESWNLVDEYIDGNPNPHWLGSATTYAYKGKFYRILFYGADSILNIEPTAKVEFRNNIYAGSGTQDAGEHGTVNVEGILIANILRGWKRGNTMEVNVSGDGYLELNELWLGGDDYGKLSTGWCNLMGGTIITNDMRFILDGYIDITGGELLVLNSNWSVADVEAAIAAGDIFNSNVDEGYIIDITTVDVDGTLYTSVTLTFDPLQRAIYLLGQAINTKDSANEVLDEALAMEMTAKGLLDEVLMGLDPADPNYENVEDAKAMTQVAIVGERACQRKINKTAGKLESALGLLGAGDGSNPPKPPKP
ncbi:MAG: hypothetical protein JSW23_06975 [Planctomycetota bacterium]|nr:MAG: hypothetical protein JSW23_06975 [Planctomycetota bacterium]